MNLERRMKYFGSGKTVNKSGVQVNINFNAYTLGIMSSYVITDNRNIRRGHLVNLRNLFSMIDFTSYQQDPVRMKYVNFINRVLKAKLDDGLKDPLIIEKYVNGGIIEDDTDNSDKVSIFELQTLSSSELDWVTNTISEALKYSFIYNDVDKLYDMLVRFRACDYGERGPIVKEIEEEISQLNTLFRKAKAETSSEVTFSLKDGLMEDAIKEIHDQLTNPSCRLYTGMQGFNELIGGAFETTRVYMLMGLAGAGKSLSLLNIARQLKSNNKHFRAKDPTKTPVIVILTMENSVKETVERLFEISTGNDIKNFSADDAIRMMKEQGELYISDDNPIDIIVKYVPNRSVDTSYLYTLAEDLEDEGYEMICLIQDHVKRIRSIERGLDLRIELGNVINEFKTFATLKDCVVITNGHLNREAAKTIDDGSRGNKSDLIRMIGRANISESMLMIDNLDVGIVITQEYDENGNKYMGFKRIKERIKVNPNFNIVYQMFKSPESLAFVEDMDKRVPLHKDTLKAEGAMISINTGINDNKYKILEDNSENVLGDGFNIFDYKSGGNRYGNIPQKEIKDNSMKNTMLRYIS